MQISEKGLALTRSFEGLRLSAYRDVAGVWTIGYGHTGANVHAGLTITEPEAASFLRADMSVAEATVNQRVTVPLNQNQFDALVDFAYNVGCGAFRSSHMLALLNSRDYVGACSQFTLWDHAGGVVIEGLLDRRKAEAALFMEAV